MSKEQKIKELESKGHEISSIAKNESGEGYILVDFWTDNAFQINFDKNGIIINERDLFYTF